jgi:Zn finger protein HypA/HybF involved in hydrogenase expression
MVCSYGCGNPGTFKTNNGKLCCSDHFNKCPKIRERNSQGVKIAHKKGLIPGFTNQGWAKGLKAYSDPRCKSKNYTDIESVFASTRLGPHKEILIQERGHKCEGCGLAEWRSQPITLELEHINGNRTDNTRENLQILCPNCHSQTQTWRGRNMNTGVTKVSDEDLLAALRETANIRQALMKVGLTPKGGNYSRAQRIKVENCL